MSDIAHRVLTIVAQAACRDVGEITPADTFETLGFDSLDNVEVVMLIEEEFDLEIHDDEAEAVHSVGALVALVERRLS